MRAIRRTGMLLHRTDRTLEESWISEYTAKLTPYLICITYKYIDDSVEETIRDNHTLSECRTLDAIHLGTALYFQAHHSEPLRICCLDRKMRKTAATLGFRVLPETI